MRLVAAVLEVEAAVALGVVPEILDLAVEPRAGVREQAEVEAAVRHLVCRGVAFARRRGRLEVRDPDIGELGVAELGDGEAHREAVEDDPHRVEVLEVLGGQGSHADAPLRLGVQQALRLEQPHRLAQRRAAHAELGRELDLRERRAGLEVAEQDLVPQLLVGVAGAGAAVERLVRRRISRTCTRRGAVAAAFCMQNGVVAAHVPAVLSRPVRRTAYSLLDMTPANCIQFRRRGAEMERVDHRRSRAAQPLLR